LRLDRVRHPPYRRVRTPHAPAARRRLSHRGASRAGSLASVAMTELVALLGDITTLEVDAVVNAANSRLVGGGGVDGAIHRAGGPAIYESMAPYRERGGCPPGEAVIGTGGELPARYVIHTVGPIWTDDEAERHDATLASCYRE